MRPVNLIPAEDRRGDRAPMRAGPLAYVVVGALLLAFVGVYMLVAAGNEVSERQAEIANLEQQLASSTARADALQSFSSFAALEQNRTLTVSDLARSRFDWERVMRELALVIPDDVSLTSLSGSVSGQATSSGSGGGDSSAAQGINAPNMAIAGCAGDHASVARFVAALRDIDGVTRVGLSSSIAGSTDGSTEGAAAPTSETGGSECPDPDAASFEITIAFDEVQVDVASGAVVPTAPVPAADAAGVAETEQERERARDSVESAQEQSSEAVDNYVPGT